MMIDINIFSFFSGAGFLDLGFEIEPSYRIVYVNEFHQAFNDIYKYARNKMNIPVPTYGHHVEDITILLEKENLKNLKKLVKESQEHRLTGFIGGPPCPDFSVAGKNKGKEGENGKLSGTYTELICATKPDFFLFENVKGLYRTAKHREFFELLKSKFRKAGYALTEKLVNAIEYGAPQDRERIILIGFQKSKAKQLNIPVKKTELLDFPWDKYKNYSIEQIKECPWPKTSPFQEDIVTTPPAGIINELTVECWWEKNDVTHHPNASMYFQPRAALAMSGSSPARSGRCAPSASSSSRTA